MTTRLDDKTVTFIERFSLLINERGLSRSTGKVLGLLLVCEPVYQSAEGIQGQLALSVGSVSSALQLLQRLGLVQKRTFPTDRRLYYELAPDCWQKLIDTSRRQMSRGVALADEGLLLAKNNNRLKVMKQLYQASEELLGNIRL